MSSSASRASIRPRHSHGRRRRSAPPRRQPRPTRLPSRRGDAGRRPTLLPLAGEGRALPPRNGNPVPKALILVGMFGAPHGVRGDIRLKSHTSDPLAIACYGALTDAAGARRFEIVMARVLRSDILVVRLKGIEDRAAAAALTNLELYVPRDKLPPTEAEEFYHADLVGLEACGPDGERFGRVVAVRNFGAGDLLEIAPPTGEARLLPFTKPVVPVVDLAAGRLVVIPPREIEAENDAQGAAEPA
ncbi:MAG: ribosome maturation factor RimM [Methylobacteriaceae bacterium]|nr:ribosome maturation factor RimM [Methylobacteriaceae bacterium]